MAKEKFAFVTARFSLLALLLFFLGGVFVLLLIGSHAPLLETFHHRGSDGPTLLFWSALLLLLAAGGTAHFLLDFNTRTAAERALRASEEEFRTFFENTTVGASQLDLSGRFLRVNERFCQITGYSREELLCMTPKELTHPEERARDWERIQGFLRGEIPGYRTEKRYVCKDGRIIWVEVTTSLVRDRKGIPLRTASIIQDITARKFIEKELRAAKAAAEEASRAKSEFLAKMSHEIRTPMTVFLAGLEHLLEIDDDPARRQLLLLANSAGERLRAVIDDILDFSRLEAGRLEIVNEPFNPRDCLRQAAEMLAIAARDKALRLETEVAADVPEQLIGDPERLQQVLLNLIGNAIKFTETGEVRVSVAAIDRTLRFTVSDSGIGIPEDKKSLLFQLFSQLDNSSTRKHGGSGLGLAICKGLVELMGGGIDYRPRAGGGSVFTFTVPLRVAEEEFAGFGGKDRPEKVLAGHPGTRILLVEDDPASREMIRLLLSQYHCRIETAQSGREAVLQWRQGNFDLILMDVQMPEMTGVEATAQIRALEKAGERVCIVGLTAHASVQVRQECLAAGMDDCLAKPVRLGTLFAAIADCVKAREKGQAKAMTSLPLSPAAADPAPADNRPWPPPVR